LIGAATGAFVGAATGGEGQLPQMGSLAAINAAFLAK
jgi:hypothetical protein